MRNQTSYAPDNTLEGVAPEDIQNNALEARHVGVDAGIPLMIEKEITADATSGIAIFDANAPVKFEIVDVIVQARATVGGGTMKLTDGTNDITDAIVCAVDTTVVRAGTINDAYSEIAVGGTLKVVSTNAGDRALVTIIARKKA